METLVYYPDTLPGIRRIRRGKGFSYLTPEGQRLRDAAERVRIAKLAIPPAYEDVWICPDPLGHLQATGRDARGRKQYRYHIDWTAVRATHKYDTLARFGRALPAIRRRIARDLSDEADEASFALAAVAGLLDRLALRIGNASYEAENGSYGITTLKPRHVTVEEREIAFRFPGKGGKLVQCRLRDRRLHHALEKMQDLPGGRIFSWRDEAGAIRSVSSQAVNQWLAETTADTGFTAKTFRTWSGTLAAFQLAQKEEKLTTKALAQAAADRLHNTPTIARSSYIHPAVLALAGPDGRAGLKRLRPPSLAGLRPGEGELIAFLERMARAAVKSAA